MKYLLFATLLLMTITACKNRNSISVIVETKNGTIEGYELQEKGLHIFKGVPFAQPPVGELRWKAPHALQNWDGIKQCKKFSAIAMQGEPNPFYMWTSEFIAPKGNMSEDCLYLNIWTPAKINDEKLPVMVFIHGGGFSSGSGSVPLYDGENMAQKGVVFITINYRVGIFGFFSHPELTSMSEHNASGNQGLLDQVAALQWIHDNIAMFGGDPDNVTIAGQSAGAFSVSFLTASHLCNGIVHKAIAESGGATLAGNRLTGSISLQEAEKTGLELQKLAGVNSLKELQNISAKDILKLQIPAIPIVDGYFLNKSVTEIYNEGKQNDIPLITGWNKDEGLGTSFKNIEQYVAGVKAGFNEKAEDVLSIFPYSTPNQAKESQGKLNALGMFGVQTYNWMLMQNATGSAPVYVYQFNRDVPYGEGQENFGAFHSSELGYAYDNLEKSNVRPWTAADKKLAEKMSSYWINFAKTGDPNGDQLPEWNPSKSENDKIMSFDVNIKAIDFQDLEQLKVLRKIYIEK